MLIHVYQKHTEDIRNRLWCSCSTLWGSSSNELQVSVAVNQSTITLTCIMSKPLHNTHIKQCSSKIIMKQYVWIEMFHKNLRAIAIQICAAGEGGRSCFFFNGNFYITTVYTYPISHKKAAWNVYKMCIILYNYVWNTDMQGLHLT